MQHYYTPPDLLSSTGVILRDREHHHATRSCRITMGERITVTDGRGRRVIARVTSVNAVEVCAAVEQDISGAGELPLPVEIGLAVIAPPRFETAVEKCTELGAAAITPVITARMEPHLDGRLKTGRLGRIALGAAKQAGRSVVPEVTPPVRLDAFANGFDGLLLVASQHTEARMAAYAAETSPAVGVRILVGPEGDFTAEEFAMLRNAGAREFGMGGLTLRSETAAIAAMTLMVDILRP